MSATENTLVPKVRVTYGMLPGRAGWTAWLHPGKGCTTEDIIASPDCGHAHRTIRTAEVCGAAKFKVVSA